MLKTKIQFKDRYVRSFIINRYGNGSSVVKIDRRSFLGKVVELAASKIGYAHCLPRQPIVDNLAITIEMPDSLKNDFIQHNKAFLLSEVLSRHFYDMFLVEIEVLVEGGLSDYDAVSHYMKKYNLYDDGKIDDKLRKKWRDHQYYLRKKIERANEKKVEEFLAE
jgi:hypothetical protein